MNVRNTIKYGMKSVAADRNCSVFLLPVFGKASFSVVVGSEGESFLASIGKGYPFRIFARPRPAAGRQKCLLGSFPNPLTERSAEHGRTKKDRAD